MTRTEFDRLILVGGLVRIDGPNALGVTSARAKNGAIYTLRPDLPGLPVVKPNDSTQAS